MFYLKKIINKRCANYNKLTDADEKNPVKEAKMVFVGKASKEVAMNPTTM